VLLIHTDQTGFVQGRLSPDNLRRYFDILFYTNVLKTPNVVVSLDAETALDRVEWTYMYIMSVLSRFRLLYSNDL
jgi:hypothetical protein